MDLALEAAVLWGPVLVLVMTYTNDKVGDEQHQGCDVDWLPDPSVAGMLLNLLIKTELFVKSGSLIDQGLVQEF